MENLAGVLTADVTVQQELSEAGVPIVEISKTIGEVPCRHIGKLGKWTFYRAWSYWIVSVEDYVKGLSVEEAIKMHQTAYPVPHEKYKLLGDTIRCGGHCGCPHPNEYGAQPIHDEIFLAEVKSLGLPTQFHEGKEYPHLTYGEISKLYAEGKLKTPRFIDHYHVDDQIGLNELVKILKQNNNSI